MAKQGDALLVRFLYRTLLRQSRAIDTQLESAPARWRAAASKPVQSWLDRNADVPRQTSSSVTVREREAAKASEAGEEYVGGKLRPVVEHAFRNSRQLR